MVKLFFFLICISISSQTNRDWKKDSFGRSYRISQDKIIFSIDEDYKQTIPDSKQIYIHLAEADELFFKRRYIDSIFLNRSIISCGEFISKERNFIKLAKKNLSKLISKYYDTEKKIQKLSDVVGCYHEDKLLIQNDSFAYKIFTDSRFDYVFPRDEYRFAREEADINWKISYFKMSFEKEIDDTLEEIYRRYNLKLFYEPENFVSLIIGETFHKHNFPKTSSYKDYWDNRRGLLPNIKTSLNFKREEITNSSFLISFNLVDKSELKRSFIGKEFYFFEKNKGVFILILFPIEMKTVGEKISEEIKINIRYIDDSKKFDTIK